VNHAKSILFGLMATTVFWFSIEAATRFVLYVKTKDTGFLLYGFLGEKPKQDKCRNVFDAQGNKIYHKLIPSHNPQNPVNSYGFRGPEILDKTQGTTRIVCLGGSTTYGLSLDYSDSYPKLLQDSLNRACGDRRYEIINAGIPAFKLPNIIALVENEILALRPDIIILMSVFNNLHNERMNVFFTAIEGEEKYPAARYLIKVAHRVKKYSLLFKTIEDIARKGFRDFLLNIDWKGSAKIIMSSSEVWEQYRRDIKNLLMLLTINSIDVIVLDEAFNRVDYPELAPPVDKATEILLNVSKTYNNVRVINIADAIHEAQKRGEQVWVAPYHDPVHLSRRGNEIIAESIAKTIYCAQIF